MGEGAGFRDTWLMYPVLLLTVTAGCYLTYRLQKAADSLSERVIHEIERRASTMRRLAFTGLAIIVAAVAAALALELAQTAAGDYSHPEPAFGLLATVTVAASALVVIWKRSAKSTIAYAGIAAAFVCMWTAAGDSVEVFTSAQWVVLGLSIAIGTVLTWKRL